MKALSALLLTLLATPAFAGGGGVSPAPKQGILASCHGVSGNVTKVIVYHTDGGGGLPHTYVDVSLRELELSYFYEVAEGIADPSEALGTFRDIGVLVTDPSETLGFASSGVFGDATTTLARNADGTISVTGSLRINRAKNAPIDGPTFDVNGTVRCGL